MLIWSMMVKVDLTALIPDCVQILFFRDILILQIQRAGRKGIQVSNRGIG